MIAGILRETGNENRVALLPCETGALRKLGLEVMLEEGAGERAFASDAQYIAAGAVTGGEEGGSLKERSSSDGKSASG